MWIVARCVFLVGLASGIGGHLREIGQVTRYECLAGIPIGIALWSLVELILWRLRPASIVAYANVNGAPGVVKIRDSDLPREGETRLAWVLAADKVGDIGRANGGLAEVNRAGDRLSVTIPAHLSSN